VDKPLQHVHCCDFSGTYASAYGRAVAVDPAGNVYSSGRFDGMTDFDPGPGTANLTSNGEF